MNPYVNAEIDAKREELNNLTAKMRRLANRGVKPDDPEYASVQIAASLAADDLNKLEVNAQIGTRKVSAVNPTNIAASGNIGAVAQFAKSGKITASMSIGSADDGGVTVPTEFGSRIDSVAQLFSPMRKIARVVAVNSGSYEQIVSVTAQATEWRAETDTRQDKDTPTLKSVKPPNGEISAVAPITQWLLQDSYYNLEAFIAEEIGKAFGVAEGAAFISGTGTDQPKGILAYTLAAQADAVRAWGTIENMKSGADGVLTVDNLIDLLYKLKPQYRANASFIMNPTTLAAVRKIKDQNDAYLWQPSTVAGQPSTLCGVPVYEDPNVPAPGVGSNSVIVGDFRQGYLVTDIGRPIVLRDDVTSKGTVKIWMAKRVGGALLDSNALKVLTLAA